MIKSTPKSNGLLPVGHSGPRKKNRKNPWTTFWLISKLRWISPVPQWQKFLQRIPRSGWLANFNGDFLVQRYISGEIFTKIRSLVLCEVANRQTHRHTERQTDRCWVTHTLLGAVRNGLTSLLVVFRCQIITHQQKTSATDAAVLVSAAVTRWLDAAVSFSYAVIHMTQSLTAPGRGRAPGKYCLRPSVKPINTAVTQLQILLPPRCTNTIWATPRPGDVFFVKLCKCTFG